MGCFKYNRLLRAAKIDAPYQNLPFKVFREIYPYTMENFEWRDTLYTYRDEELLWYKKITRGSAELIVVDIPWWKAQLFAIYMWFYCVRQIRLEEKRKLVANSGNLILEDVQKTLEDEIRKNLKSVQREAAKQQEIAERLSSFEHDYIKSQIEVEV